MILKILNPLKCVVDPPPFFLAPTQNVDYLGVDSVIEMAKTHYQTLDGEENVTLGVIGWPSVGKTSVLSGLRQRRVKALNYAPGLVIIDPSKFLFDNKTCFDIIFFYSTRT